MFEKVKEMLRHGRRESACADPSAFGDPLALQTSWEPAAPGGANFGTHRLMQTASHRIEFVPTLAWRLFSLAFLLAGSGVIVFQLQRFGASQAAFPDATAILPLVLGVAFAVAGGLMWWFGGTPRVFDHARAMFWRGRRQPAMVGTGGREGAATPLSAIHALQLISEYVSGDKGSYYSHELNLVLADGRRINVVDHGNLEHLRDDAQTLSRFLHKPIWDATVN